MTRLSHRTIDAIVDEQVVRWQLQGRRRSRAGAALPRPIITISRRHGAGGVELGRMLAEKLDYSYWHKDLLHEIATHQDMSERMLASFDEHRRSVIAELVGNLVLVNRAQSDYVRALAKTLHAIATHGGAVIVGRGANYVLDPAGALRVQAMAPLEFRVQHMVAHGLTEAEARKEIARVDRERAEFIHQAFGQQFDDPLGYDLVLNMASYELPRAVEVVLAALRARFPDRL